MHIPDGFLDAKTWVSTTILGATAVGYASKRASLVLQREQVPKMGLLGAFIFATQMVNFPVAGATSGHFLGGALAAILFGPWVGSLLMAAVLIVQAFFFQDGGVTVLGANILCTGVIGSFVGYGAYHTFQKFFKSERLRGMAGFMAGWLSLVAASFAVACLLAWSGTVPFRLAVSAMVGWHSLIGIGEGLITAWVLSYVHRTYGTSWQGLVSKQGGER